MELASAGSFGDLRVRTGIKLGLAGLIALFCAQMLRVPDDNWAILTVFVLMDAKYVGALACKAIMRLTGTIVGALIGVWLASDYASTPAIFLSVFFLVMVFAGYKVGQVGARQVPYAYYLLGLTTLTIASAGVTDPAQAWQTGLDRTEEIFIGIISSLLVNSLLWPRYGREEFLGGSRAALKTIGQLFSVHAQAYLTPADALVEIEQLHRTFDQQFSRLNNLLQVGARESTVFCACGMWIATIVNRLFWPILPQKVLRRSLLAFCSRIKGLLGGDFQREKILTQIPKLMGEALGAAPQIRIAGCSENERLKLVALIHSLQMLGSRINHLGSPRPVLRSPDEGGNLLPEVAEQIMRPQFEHLEIEIIRVLDAFAECFREGDCSREFPTIDGALAEMDHAIQQIRDRNLLGDLPTEASLRVLDLVDRYHASADTLEQCGEMLHALRIERYWGDYAL